MLELVYKQSLESERANLSEFQDFKSKKNKQNELKLRFEAEGVDLSGNSLLQKDSSYSN